MKSTFKIFFLMLPLFFLGQVGYGQMSSTGSHYVEAEIALKGYEFRGNFVVISYEIPYSGMVEIRLFNQSGDKIWQNQYADKYGENTIVLKKSKFHPGETYAYVLNYKKDEIRDRLIIPPTGFE